MRPGVEQGGKLDRAAFLRKGGRALLGIAAIGMYESAQPTVAAAQSIHSLSTRGQRIKPLDGCQVQNPNGPTCPQASPPTPTSTANSNSEAFNQTADTIQGYYWFVGTAAILGIGTALIAYGIKHRRDLF